MKTDLEPARTDVQKALNKLDTIATKASSDFQCVIAMARSFLASLMLRETQGVPRLRWKLYAGSQEETNAAVRSAVDDGANLGILEGRGVGYGEGFMILDDVTMIGGRTREKALENVMREVKEAIADLVIGLYREKEGQKNASNVEVLRAPVLFLEDVIDMKKLGELLGYESRESKPTDDLIPDESTASIPIPAFKIGMNY